MNDKFVFAPRIIRSPWADFYYTEIETALQTHPDDYLKEIAFTYAFILGTLGLTR